MFVAKLAILGNNHAMNFVEWMTNSLCPETNVINYDIYKLMRNEEEDINILSDPRYIEIFKMVDASIIGIDIDKEKPFTNSVVIREKEDGSTFFQELRRDSSGVREHFAWEVQVFKVVYEDKVVFADEMDRVLNPVLSDRVIAFINGKEHHGQFIFTTHKVLHLDLKNYTKAKYVFEILVQNVDYDASAENNQNIISAFLNRATVCQGYACATQYLLRLLGIQSAIVTGNANGESHAWNLVRLDGEYYYMDTTWGNSRYLDSSSQMEKYVNYNYLAITSEEISRTHILDNSFQLPECTHMEDNYFIKEKRYFEEWNPEGIGALLTESWNAGGGDVAVKFASHDLYEQALKYFITDQHIADYCENISSVFYLEDKELYVLTFHFL